MTLSSSRSRFGLSDILMLLAVVMWGVNFSFIKIALREMSPQGFNGLRLLLTAALFLAVLAISGQGFRVPRADLWKLALLGIGGNALYQVLFIGGVSRTTASNTSLILCMTPIFIALFSVALRVERVHWLGWIGIAVSFAGLYLVVTQRSGGVRLSGDGLRGDLMIFGGTLLWASYTVFSKGFLERHSPLKFSALTVVFGALVYVPLTAREIVRLPWAEISPRAWASLVFSALFGLVLGYLIWYYSVQRVGNARTAAYNNLTPIFTALFAALLLGERLRPVQAAGAAVILAGVYLTRSSQRFVEGPPEE